MKTAVLFPGQGAQYVGMGHDFYERFPVAKKVFAQCADVLGDSINDIIFHGPEEVLQDTANTQPAILTVSMAIYRVLEELGIKADGFAGLSLGEYSALVAANAISFADALPLVQKRGIYMQKAVPAGEGTMMAIMGISHDMIDKVCADAASEGLVAPANYNCPGQVVISGQVSAVRKAADLAREAGAKKVIELKVSAPFHCSLLKPVEERLAKELEAVEIRNPEVPVVFNVSALFADEPLQIRANLVNQVSNPILWEQSVRSLMANGINKFIGVGPGNSLSRLMKRIAPEFSTISIEDAESVEIQVEKLLAEY